MTPVDSVGGDTNGGLQRTGAPLLGVGVFRKWTISRDATWRTGTDVLVRVPLPKTQDKVREKEIQRGRPVQGHPRPRLGRRSQDNAAARSDKCMRRCGR